MSARDAFFEKIMKRLLMILVICLSLFTISIFSQTKVRVNFPKHKTEKVINGTIKGKQYIDYVFRIQQIGSIEVSFSSANKKLSYAVRNPDGFLIDDDSEGKNFIGFAGKIGDYSVRVYGDRKNLARFKLKIAILKV